MQARQPKLADVVAARLRDRILSGELKDGDELPRQEDLLAEFGVSTPSLR
jgi:GntR family transcriptional repressor for pyruvate dehydrogenase complex